MIANNLSDLRTILDSIVPHNLKNLALVKECTDIFVEMIERNSTISQRISKLFDIDKTTFLSIDKHGNITEIEDSDFLKECKNNLKNALFLKYLNVLYTTAQKIQLDPKVKEATDLRSYMDSLIYKDIYDILTSEYLGAFRFFQQNSGTKQAIKYIYQFSKYIETGYIYDDLQITDEGCFDIKYEGSLHAGYFNEFTKPMAHLCGWCYEYITIIEQILEDFYGIEYTYTLPRITLSKNNNDIDNSSYIVFTEKTIQEFYQSLSNNMNPLRDTKFSTLDINEIKRKSIARVSSIEEYQSSKDKDIILFNVAYVKYNPTNSTSGIVYLKETNGNLTCLQNYNKRVYYGLSSDAYVYDRLYVFGADYHLDIGNENTIKESWNFTYTDEFSTEETLNASYVKNAFYYANDFSKAFKVQGNTNASEYPLTPGVDESKYKVTNYSRNNYNSYILNVSFVSNNLTYLELSDNFGHSYKTNSNSLSEINVNTHGWYGDTFTFRAYDASEYNYDYFIEMNILNKVRNSITITSLEILNGSVIIKGKSNSNGTYVFNGSSNNFSVDYNSNFKILIDTEDLEEYPIFSEYTLSISNGTDTINIHSNGLNTGYGNFKFNIPIYKNIKLTSPRLSKISTSKMLHISVGDTTLGELTKCNAFSDYHITDDNLDEYNRLKNLDLNNYDSETYLNCGYKKVNTDSIDCYVPDSTDFVQDDFTCYVDGLGQFLYFTDDVSNSDVFLTTYYNLENYNKERGHFGYVLTFINQS